jgi:hypothetical protein
LAHLERELASLQSRVGMIKESYGVNHLHLSVAASYVSTLMANEVVAQWLIEQYPEYSSQFQTITDAGVTRMEGEQKDGMPETRLVRVRGTVQDIG